MNRKSIVVILLQVFSGFLLAQESNRFSLEEAQKYAEANSPQNQKALLDIQIALKKVAETRAIGLPQVTSETKVQKFIDIPVNLAPARSFNPAAPADALAELQFGLNYNNSIGISASQLIFDGSYIVALQASQTYKSLSETSQVKTLIEIKEAVKQAYYTVLVANENTGVLIESLKSTSDILKETEALYGAGLVEEQSVDQLKLTVNEITTAVGIAQGQIRFAEKLLKLQMGYHVDSSIVLSDELDAFISGISAPDSEREFVPASHVDFKLTAINSELMKLNLRKEKFSFLPSLNLVFNHQQQNMNNKFDFFSGGKFYPSTVIGASLRLPILTSGMRLAKVSQAKIEHEKSLIDLRQAEQNLIYRSQLALSNYDTEYNTYLNNRASMDLAKKIHDKTLKKYKEGIASSLELTQTQNQFLTAEANYIRSVLDVLKSKSELEKSFGTNQ